VKTASSISGNRPFLGPVNLLRDTSHTLIIALCLRHSRTLLSSTPKTTAALRFPFSSVHRITSHLNFAVYQGSSTFQIVRATVTISMMPAGHKAIHDVHIQIIGKSGRSVNLTTNRYIMCRQRARLGFVVIFSKRPAGHALKTPAVYDSLLDFWRPSSITTVQDKLE
jgi:hypothetical protein